MVFAIVQTSGGGPGRSPPQSQNMGEDAHRCMFAGGEGKL